jgi:hypothetical protein
MAVRTPPRDQEAFALMLQLLRAAADNSPVDATERAFVEKLRSKSTVSQPDAIAVARAVVANFDRLTPSRRRQALGPFEGTRAAPAAATVPGAFLPGTPIVALRLPRTTTHGSPTTSPGVDTGGGTPVRSYRLEYVGFHCEHERGDPGWSDEVYVITSVVTIEANGDNTIRTEKHPVDQVEYGDVDLMETRLGPRASCYQGRNSVVSLTVVAFERDFGDPDRYRDEVDVLVTAAILALAYYSVIGAGAVLILDRLSGLITDGLNWLLGTGDDQVDTAQIQVFDLPAIEALGRLGKRRYISHVNILGTDHPVTTDLASHVVSVHRGGGAVYVFGFDWVRDPPFVEDPRDVE